MKPWTRAEIETEPFMGEGREKSRATLDALETAVDEVAQLKKQLAQAQAGRVAMHAALNEALEAIDMVESEPGRGGEPIFKVDWLEAMKLVRELPDVTCLDEYVAAALRAGGRS